MSRTPSMSLALVLTQLMACGAGGEGDCGQLQVITYPDADGDGFGSDADAQETCGIPAGRTESPGDCDDTRFNIYVGAAEICDDIDNDCDGTIDDGLADLEWYIDGDGDGYGTDSETVEACSQPEGYTATADDCDDSNEDRYPSAIEICGDGVDSNCNGFDCNDFQEDFETGSIEPFWILSGDAIWRIGGANPYEGSYYVRSGSISDSQTSSMQVALDFTDPGTLSFWHSGSTELNYDFLIVYVDGVEMMSLSGMWGWTFEQIPVAAGPHAIMFQYAKDVSFSNGDDAVYVDLIQATNAL